MSDTSTFMGRLKHPSSIFWMVFIVAMGSVLLWGQHQKSQLKIAWDAMPTEGKALSLIERNKVATLSTLLLRQGGEVIGSPFGSVVPYVVDDNGTLIVMLSDIAVHAKNILGDRETKVVGTSETSFLITEINSKNVDLDSARVTLVGVLYVDEDVDKERYFKVFPDARIYEEFHDFRWYRFEATSIYYVGGFGPKPIDWLDVEIYRKLAKER